MIKAYTTQIEVLCDVEIDGDGALISSVINAKDLAKKVEEDYEAEMEMKSEGQ